MRVRVLGCGSSGGTPLVGPDGWGGCNPDNPKNRRRRPSILVEEGSRRLLVDTSPDLREQLLDAGIWEVDAIIYTHAHADHTNGIDDIRSLNYHAGGALDAYATHETLAILQERFAYVFEPYGDRLPAFFRPCLTPQPVNGPFEAAGIPVVPFEQQHGRMPSMGIRIGEFAYSTDVKTLPDEAFDVLRGVSVWIVDCLSLNPHPTHSHLEQTLEWIERVKPDRAVLTHLSHRMDYDELSALLPDGVEPGYDGLELEIA